METDSIAEQAAGWLICLKTPHVSPDDPFRDPAVRNAAFFDWVKRSPTHLLLFMEMVELERRFRRIDPNTLTDIDRLTASISNDPDGPTDS